MSTAPTSSDAAVWHLRLDGRPRLLSARGAEVLLERRDGALLAYLALEGSTARDRLLSLLWPGETAPALRGRLRQRVYALKRKLGTEAIEGALALKLSARVHWAGLAIEADDKPPLDSDDFRDLPDLAEWLATLRQRQQTLQRDRLAEQASALEREGQLARAIALAERLVLLSPAQEHAHRRLMRLHYLRGDRAAALAAFDRCEAVLKDEVGARPSAETLDLLAQIESSATLGDSTARKAVPVTVLRPPRLVGRQEEWQRLQAAWLSVRAVVVVGEAGLGKSRLLSDLAAAHGLNEGRVVMVSARPGDERVPYAVLGRLLRALLARSRGDAPAAWVAAELSRLLPELGAPAASATETRPARLLSAVEQFLTQARDDGLDAVILDDLHFCDAASVEAAQQLVAAAVGLRWLVALRGAELSPEAQAYVDDLVANAQAETLVLQPLTEAQIAELLGSLQIPGIDGASLAGPLLQRTGGNVMYLLETLKALLLRDAPADAQTQATAAARLDGRALAQLPVAASVGRLVEQRLARLSPAALRLARCAAIAGHDFSAPLAAQVLGVRPLDLSDAWSELESAQVLRDGAFAHDLIFDAVQASVPAAIATAFHGEVAAWLESRQADASRVAHHWQAAQQWPLAGHTWRAAALQCARQGRRTEQARCLALAADCYGQARDAGRRIEALLDRAAALAQFEAGDQARQALAALDTEVQTDAHWFHLMTSRLALTNAWGEFNTTLDMAPAAVDRARAAGDEEAVFSITLQWTAALTKSYRAADTLALLQPLRPWVDRAANESQRYEYWNGLALALDFNNRLSESQAAWQASCEVAEAMDYDLLPQALNNMGYTCAKMGKHERAVVLARRALAISRSRAEDFDMAGLGAFIKFSLGHHLRNLGCYREALDLMQEAAQGFEAGGAGMVLASVQNQLALCWVQLGQPGRAQPLVAGDLPEQTAVQRAQRLAFRATVLAAQGRPAVDEIRRALALAPLPDSLPHRMWSLVATALVDPQEGEALAVAVADWSRARERLGMTLASHGRAARCAWQQGGWQRALPHVEEALRLTQDVQPDLYYLPELWWTAAQVYAAAGQRADRRAVVRVGAHWVQRVARDHVPELFRDSFLRGNPFNADLLRWAGEPQDAA
jgi:DNA-binding SARP family transcriptional activator